MKCVIELMKCLYGFRNTNAGRYLIVIFIYKQNKEALILSARDMEKRSDDGMNKNTLSKLPKFASIDKLVGLFDTHDMGDYLEDLPEVHFEVDIQSGKQCIPNEEPIITP